MPAQGDHDYDAGAPGYAAVRRADPRIGAPLLAALGAATSVVNVGAGGGSYEPADRRVVAVEPSAWMRAQRPPGAAPVVAATALALPFADDAFDAAMATITVHQWPDPTAGLRELRRVARGPVVVLTFDAVRLHAFWLATYVPALIAAEAARYPAPAAILTALGGHGRIEEIPVAADCTDGFGEAFYARPEAFLDPAVRAAQSGWAFVKKADAAAGLARLEADLSSGAWDDRYGHLRREATYPGSLRLIVGEPEPLPSSSRSSRSPT